MKKRFYCIIFSILSIYTVEAQNSYSLNFNGQSDYIEVIDASAMITNNDQMSITGWVYPRNANSGWPDFDGFFGFRNELDADFYLLQLDNYKVEARLRISLNDYFSVVTAPNSISTETWYHLALIYDGTNLIIYINGIEAGSTGASGQITNESVPLKVGRLVFQTTNFDLDGQADEIGLWNVALTPQQIQDYMYADLTGEEGLVGYWNFNEGSGDTANDASGNDNDGLIYGANWSTNIPFQGIYINDQQIMEDEALMMDLSYIGETMSYDAHSDTSAVSALIEGQTLLLTPLPNWYGTSTITVYMTDENNLLDTTSFVLTVSSVNDPPTIAAVDDISIPEDGTGSIVLNVTDVDNVDLMFNFYTNQPFFNFSVIEDTLFVSPILNWNGQANLTIFVSDGENSDNTSLGITVTPVNDPPTIEEIDDITINEDSSIDVILNSEDVDGDELTYSFVLDNYDLSLGIDEDTLTVNATPDFNGDVPITMLVSDSELIDSTSFMVTVTPVNDAPLEFGLISPTVLDTFQINSSTDETIPFTWETSFDVDSDVTYKLTVTLDYLGNVYTQDYENITDSSTAISTYEYAVFMTDLNLSLWNIDYVVEASDEEFTVISQAGEFILVNTSLSIASEIIPEAFALHQNYPNPFNPITSLRYDLPQDGLVNVTVCDMMGRLVKTLVNSSQTAGYKSIQWNATNDRNEPVSAGLYLYMIQAGEFRKTRKMVLLK